jgi:hypothetical protein
VRVRYEDYNWVGTKLGVDAIAPSSVSFHFTPAGEMRALEFMLSILNKRGGVTPDEFMEEVRVVCACVRACLIAISPFV